MEILLILILVVCGVFWHVCKEELSSRRRAKEEWMKEMLLTEAEGVILDFLDYGREVAQATNGMYRGTVSVRMHGVYKSGELGFYISMYDSGDLTSLSKATVGRLHLEGFVKKYGYYYDAERNSIVYQTSNGVHLQLGEREELTKKLIRRIENHPLAMIKSENMIGTRGI